MLMNTVKRTGVETSLTEARRLDAVKLLEPQGATGSWSYRNENPQFFLEVKYPNSRLNPRSAIGDFLSYEGPNTSLYISSDRLCVEEGENFYELVNGGLVIFPVNRKHSMEFSGTLFVVRTGGNVGIELPMLTTPILMAMEDLRTSVRIIEKDRTMQPEAAKSPSPYEQFELCILVEKTARKAVETMKRKGAVQLTEETDIIFNYTLRLLAYSTSTSQENIEFDKFIRIYFSVNPIKVSTGQDKKALETKNNSFVLVPIGIPHEVTLKNLNENELGFCLEVADLSSKAKRRT